MSRTKLTIGAVALAAGVGACGGDVIVVAPTVPAPTGLTYELEPSGDPLAPSGLLLRWLEPPNTAVDFYRIYSRDGGSAFALRGETSSISFHDVGIPHYEYYVTAIVGSAESQASNIVQVDERSRLQAPASLASVSLDGAIHLAWSDNPYASSPNTFRAYRVYSAPYSLDNGLCDVSWVLEGSTVAPEFLAGALTNGVPRCFGVSALSIEGWESLWSPIRADTPRPDARNVLVWAYQAAPLQSGFRFWIDANGDRRAQRSELGHVLDGNRTDLYFWIFRDPADGSFWFVPERVETAVQVYGATPIDDLTSIDFAPVGGYTRSAVEALPGFGYVFEMDGGDGFLRYGGLRVTHVGQDYVIFDWSFQDDPGNPELSIVSVASTR